MKSTHNKSDAVMSLGGGSGGRTASGDTHPSDATGVMIRTAGKYVSAQQICFQPRFVRKRSIVECTPCSEKSGIFCFWT